MTQVVTLLNEDVDLLAVLTGGCHEYPRTGRKGLTRILTPQAFNDQTGIIRPCAVVLELDQTADGQIVGESMSYENPLIVWIYDRGDSKDQYVNIEAASAIIFPILHLAAPDGVCQLIWDHNVRYKREPDLKDAAYWRMMFRTHGYLSRT